MVVAYNTSRRIIDGQVAVKGSVDLSTNRVTGLTHESGSVWQENTDNLWWSKTAPSDGWNPPGGTGPFSVGADWSGDIAPSRATQPGSASGSVSV